MKCKIDLTANLLEQVKQCILKAEDGPSPTGSKLYTCSSDCECKFQNTNRAMFIKSIVKQLELSSLKKLDTCEIEITIGPAPAQKKQSKAFR